MVTWLHPPKNATVPFLNLIFSVSQSPVIYEYHNPRILHSARSIVTILNDVRRQAHISKSGCLWGTRICRVIRHYTHTIVGVRFYAVISSHKFYIPRSTITYYTMSSEEEMPQDKSAATGVPTMAASAAPAPAKSSGNTAVLALLLLLSACAIVGVVQLGVL